MIEAFEAQMALHMKLDAAPSQDFGEWAKAKTKALGDLKQVITSKRKSLKRRHGDITQVTEDLTALLDTINSFQALLKNLAGGAGEGSDLYQGIIDLVSVDELKNVTSPVWERALRAIAFEDRLRVGSVGV